jgi:hypothetical protein
VPGVKLEYLEASFGEMQKQYGSIEKYFSEGLGIGAAYEKELAVWLSSFTPEGIGKARDGLSREHRDALIKGIFLMARIDHPEMFQGQVLNGNMHRAVSTGCIGVFELKSILLASDPCQEIEFGPGLGSPKVQVAAFERADNLFQGKAFPRRAEFRVRLDVRETPQLKQGVQNPAVTNVDLGCLDLPFADILKPGRKDSDHVGTGENVKVTSGRVFRRAERPCKLSCIPDLTMIVGDHCPETSQSLGRNRNAELRNITFEKCPDKVISPDHARTFIGSQKGFWKAASEPELSGMVSPHLFDVKPKEVDKTDTAGEGFRNPFCQVRGCRAKDKESGGAVWSIHEHPQQRKQVRASLDFIDNHQTGEVFQCPHGRRQSAKVNRVFQIEIGARFAFRQDPSKRGLATLPWPQKGGDGMDSEHLGNAV